jgi:hypothetical protein
LDDENKYVKKIEKISSATFDFFRRQFSRGVCVFGFHKIKTKPVEIVEKKGTVLRRIPMAFSVEDPENEVLFEFSDPEDIFD